MLLDKKIPIRYIFSSIRFDLIIVVIMGLIAHYLTSEYKRYIPLLPMAIPVFIGTAISVILSFKINQSYERWWEARKTWGSIVNDSRSLVIQLQAFVKSKTHPYVRRISYRHIGWTYCFGRQLRGQDPLHNLNEFITENELKLFASHKNKALAILRQHALDLRELRTENELEMLSHIQLDSTVTRLCDSMGKAERINSTVFPTTYRLFLHMAIYLFAVTLSVALRDIDIQFELPLMIILSLVFLLLEKSAYDLQDPFRNRPSDTAVTSISREIEINIKHLLGESEVPEPLKPNEFYIL